MDTSVSWQDLMTWHEAVVNARSEMVNRKTKWIGRKRGGNGNIEWGKNSNPKHSAKKRILKGLTG